MNGFSEKPSFPVTEVQSIHWIIGTKIASLDQWSIGCKPCNKHYQILPHPKHCFLSIHSKASGGCWWQLQDFPRSWCLDFATDLTIVQQSQKYDIRWRPMIYINLSNKGKQFVFIMNWVYQGIRILWKRESTNWVIWIVVGRCGACPLQNFTKSVVRCIGIIQNFEERNSPFLISSIHKIWRKWWGFIIPIICSIATGKYLWVIIQHWKIIPSVVITHSNTTLELVKRIHKVQESKFQSSGMGVFTL